MSVLKFSFVLMMLLVFASQLNVSVTLAEAGAGEREASSALTNAEGAVASAYQAALKAEEAGANVSSLLVQLNDAGGFLARGRIAFRLRDFEEAIRFADLSRDMGVEVQNAAADLKNSTISENSQRTMFTMISSVVGVALIALGSLWGWRFLKRRYGNGGFPKVN